MFEKTYIIKILSIFILSIIFIIGCATQRNLLKEDKYAIHELGTDDLKIEVTNIHLDHGLFVISGRISRISPYKKNSILGHVDVAIISSQGNLIDSISIARRSPFIPYRIQYSSFKATFSTVPPEGSIIRVGFHKKKFVEYKKFDCGANVAVYK